MEIMNTEKRIPIWNWVRPNDRKYSVNVTEAIVEIP